MVTTTCTAHHWILETSANESLGTCSLCGETRVHHGGIDWGNADIPLSRYGRLPAYGSLAKKKSRQRGAALGGQASVAKWKAGQ